ncbi:ATP-binding cassette, subfamily B/ATP-binding cassette, subfamily B, MsbA [Gemmobacter megaterium]|uniref:ATP-binding cassette, subfamily B/ATP-binding cassette, subfamily B, MsbA n=1 Tax=Gemmobacter megaterium TaxID=1086013 RepID=A0A1N7KGZ1_9RHOB|nr:ABC transporter ATP-binding protein [Gemmobacter megaterium]GGE02116.1 ABC transporter permease [Gemmobacter megaterium]SIS60868.1 ATP-binding cassette, subfamily B/ATP-binding cassette, subfamily B, MsbA [Gemmobacter megaterium]
MADAPPRPRLFARLWSDYLRPWRWQMALAFVVLLIEGSTLALLAWMLEPLFDRVFVAGEAAAIWWVGGAIFGLFTLRAITSVVSKTLLTSVSLRSATRMQVDLLARILSLDARFFQDNPPGALIERVQGDTLAVQGIWQVMLMGIGRDVIALVWLLGVALMIDPLWTAAALIGAPLLLLPTLAIQRYIRRKTAAVRVQSGERATRLDEVFHGINTVKLNRMEGYQTARFQRIVNGIVNGQVKMAFGQSFIPALIDLVTGLGFFLVLVLGGREIIAGERTVGEFMSFFTAMSLTFQPLRRLGALAGTWQTAAASLERIYEFLDLRPMVTAPRQPAALPAGTTVEFADVRLSYGSAEVLRGLSLIAQGGARTAIVGPSGAGKSTLFHLLTRLVDPQGGQITLGGVPIRDLDPAALRGLIAVVSQDAWLFDETLRENLTMGQGDIPDARLRAALEAANAAEFVDRLPLGLDTPVGPRGSALSGGQRQRVAIARAILRDAPVLLLDEATSALDSASERLVTDALDRLSQGRTTLVIAHRLATVQGADRIVVMDGGRVVDQGSHAELLARGGLYAELCRLQFAEG